MMKHDDNIGLNSAYPFQHCQTLIERYLYSAYYKKNTMIQ